MHQHYSGIEGVKVALYVVVLIGTANLVSMKYKDKNSLAASWANLFGLS